MQQNYYWQNDAVTEPTASKHLSHYRY